MVRRKLFLIAILTALCSTVQNNTANTFFILNPEPIRPYEKIIYAVGMVESSDGVFLINEAEQAYGYFQIRQVRLDDYNKHTNKKYKLNDMYDFKISKEIFLFYAERIGHHNYEKIAKNWNGSGKLTIIYWDKVKVYL